MAKSRRRKRKPLNENQKSPYSEKAVIRRPARQQYMSGIAVKGTKTKGLNLGNAREVIGANIDPAMQIDLGQNQLTPSERYGASSLSSQYDQQARGRQMQLADQLYGATQGQGPSVAELSLAKARDANVANQLAMAATLSASNPMLAARTAQYGSAAINQQSAQDAAILRAQEIATARQQLGSQLGDIRGADINVAQQNALLQQQAAADNAARADAQARAQAEVNQNALLANQQAMNSRAQAQAGLNQQANLANQAQFNDLTAEQGKINAAIESENIAAKSRENVAGIGAEATIAAAGIGALASDKKLKKNVSGGDRSIEDFMSKLEAVIYEYKNPQDGEGQRTGVMAQDAEKSKLGSEIVKDTPRGKMIDPTKALSLALAAEANLNKRLKRLENARSTK